LSIFNFLSKIVELPTAAVIRRPLLETQKPTTLQRRAASVLVAKRRTCLRT